ncbi:DUF4192 domain-containing protein [Streptomyces sp. NPDC048297]|uniref:DUF4192 domain-containing protein n=1 Tax=Streptomyces sp. NPDC048297 TaxID=3365531 RepID=UPI0037142E2B
MTNHGETTEPTEPSGNFDKFGNFDNSDITGGVPLNGPGGLSAHDTQVTLRTPAELADALPYLLGYRPEDSIVLVALQAPENRGTFGGRARLGIPASEEDWESAARQLARGLVTGGERRGTRPERMVAYVCQEPGPGESGRDVMLRLGPLVHALRTECGNLDVPVVEALCISDNRFWSYVCPTQECCPAEGTPMGMPGTSVLAAAATYAGIQVRGTLRELRARMLPWETSAALEQEIALDAAGMSLVPRILDDSNRADVATETLDLAERIIRRFAAAPPISGAHPADLRDDALLTHDEAATLILGLQDRTTRDQAAAWMEGDEAGPALRLWRALARRCIGPYGEHAAAPLTLAGWVAWSTGDDLEAREALAMALGADSDYLFARLLHQACNEGLDPESIRRCLRTERAGRPANRGAEHRIAPSEAATDQPSGTDPAPLGPASVSPASVGLEPLGSGPLGSEPLGVEDEGEGGGGAAPVARSASRRRRRVRSTEAGAGAPAPQRSAGGRGRPTRSRPQQPSAAPSHPGDSRPGAKRTTTGDTTSAGSRAGSDRREAEGKG